jgi:hypothetical protein
MENADPVARAVVCTLQGHIIGNQAAAQAFAIITAAYTPPLLGYAYRTPSQISITLRNVNGYKGRGSRPESAKKPETAMRAIPTTDMGKFSSWAWAMDVNPRFAMTVAW